MSISQPKTIFFETSAVNYLANKFSLADAVATKALQDSKGVGWHISPLVIWEILITSSEYEREKLIYFSQHLFSEKLLPSPEELIVQYIKAGCPLVEKKYPLSSKGSFSAAWSDICCVKEKTLICDVDLIRHKTNLFRDMSRQLHRAARHDFSKPAAPSRLFHSLCDVEMLLEHFNVASTQRRQSVEASRTVHLAAHLILTILCAGASIDYETIESFWKEKGIHDMQERIMFVFTELPELFHRGPFCSIAVMLRLQCEMKFSRGVYFDSLHSIYATYADQLITADDHFRRFRDELIQQFPSVATITHVDELEFTYATG